MHISFRVKLPVGSDTLLSNPSICYIHTASCQEAIQKPSSDSTPNHSDSMSDCDHTDSSQGAGICPRDEVVSSEMEFVCKDGALLAIVKKEGYAVVPYPPAPPPKSGVTGPLPCE